MPRSFSLLVAQLAVLKCAASYVPLDLHAPAERQAFMVQDCQASLVLTVATVNAPLGPRRIDLDTLQLAP